MRIPNSHHRRGGESIMTPMIDVVFLLLIFFVCTASFQIAEQILPSSLALAGSTAPEFDVEPDPNWERVVIKLSLAGETVQWTVNGIPANSLPRVHQILKATAELDATLPCILDAAADVPLGDVIDVYDVCRLVGFEKIQFAASAGG